jgi:hypothetical protein
MRINYKKFYFLSIIGVLIASIYPLSAGLKVLWYYLINGFVAKADYGKYVIPYTPLCISLLICIIAFPLLYKLFKRYSVIIASLAAIEFFFLIERGYENMRILIDVSYSDIPSYSSISSWQLSLCAATPQVLKALGKPVYAANNPAYKVHFYLIAIIIMLTILYLVYGYTRMLKEGNNAKKKPLLVQLICTVIFIGLCVLACLTAFFRNGTINISPLSAYLTSSFFIVFGVTFGVYTGCIFFGKNPVLSRVLPSFFALLTTSAMYIGELTLLGGQLYRLGNGFFFNPFLGIPFSLIDIFVILFSGFLTYIIMNLINKRKTGLHLSEE